MNSRKPIAWVVALLPWLALCGAAAAEERILAFRSDIEVHADSSMTVTETITVKAAGKLIRRGIYRDFPTDYRDRLGNRYLVDFEVLAVNRNGEAEPFHTEPRPNGVRVYVGRPNAFVEPGQHVYSIRYRSGRQLGHFETHDELYWNVTGNGWDLPIDAAGAVVTLPGSVPMEEVRLTGYTGLEGSREQRLATEISGRHAAFIATRPLAAREGLTVVVAWPKGHVHVPGRAERMAHTLAANRGLLLALIGLVMVLGYLGYAWSRYGRDPKKGVVFPHYEPPAGYSPASTRFIMRMAYDDRAFAAAVISLAVKGHLEIDASDGDYTLTRRESNAPLAAGEAALLGALFAEGNRIELKKQNHRRLSGARLAHARSLKADYQKIYFVTNSILLLPSVAATAVLALAIWLLEDFQPLAVAVFGLIVGAHVLFAFLLRAPTPRGRLLMDKLEGFRMYLDVAEKDELNLRNPPRKTPELFERYLPFALALGVEQKWAERFAGEFRRLAAAGGTPYQPRWYGGDFNPGRIGHFATGVGASLTSAIASAATPPGSSSGSGGGGSSGGGGGGGGGGGW
jgi:uncharacterized membrane protein YgcG